MTAAAGNQPLSNTLEIHPVTAAVDLLGLMDAHPERYPYLLQSAASGPELSRFDILFAFPGETLCLDGNGDLAGPFASSADGFLGSLDSWWSAEKQDATGHADLPFTGGWFLYLGYELAQEIEPGLSLPNNAGLPVAFATRIPAAVVFDRHQQQGYLVAESTHADCISRMRADIDKVTASEPVTDVVCTLVEDPPEQFIKAVERAQEHIAAGDIFQANLSRCWRGVLAGEADVISLYRQLCASNPAPFAGLLLADGFAVASSSPERLVRRRGARIDTRPIAGTRPRNEPPELASERKQELLGHPKERAEHIMLIDLERNDLGRVCVGGTVEVSEYMVVESYSHVHHIVSNVTGRARAGLKPGELIRAVFPGGTITGCPKVRCMEIISALEKRPRGAYTGSMGYLNRDGDCDLNILIRTISLRGREIEFAAGSGIVADSDPQAELEETRAKAKGMVLAMQSRTQTDID